jgi:HEAT repeat protein
MIFRIRRYARIALLALLLNCCATAASFAQSTAEQTSPPAGTNPSPVAVEKSSQPAVEEPSLPAAEGPSTPDLQEKSWQVLQSGLHSKKVAQRTEAVQALSLLSGNRQAVRFSLRAMRDKNPRVRAAAASTLGELHATNTIPALKAALSDKDPSVMLAATHALYVFKDPLAYEVYYAILMGDKKTSAGVIHSQIDRLKDPKQVAQMGFEEGIGFVPYAGIGYEAYRQLRKHDNSPVRATAARYLAQDPDAVSEDALIQVALADKNVIVREAALDALAERNDSKCIERLAKNLDDEKYPVRYRTAATIIHLGGATPRQPAAKQSPGPS